MGALSFLPRLAALPVALLALCPLRATAAGEATFFAAPGGNDSHAGSQQQPFASLGRCLEAAVQAATAGGGDAACEAFPGMYNETVRLPQKPAAAGRVTLRPHSSAFAAAGASATPSRPPSFPPPPSAPASQSRPSTSPPPPPQEEKGRVVISGLEALPLSTGWARHRGCVFRTLAPLPPGDMRRAQQLFYGGQMMVEARFPNVDVAQLPQEALSRGSWQPTGKGSVYGRVVDPALANANFSWNGALATLQVAHQFFTWTRNVTNHTVGSSHFDYPQDLPGLASWAQHPTTGGWDKNQYFLSGVLGALDAEGEWFIDADGYLYFYPPSSGPSGSCQPPSQEIALKVRDHALLYSGGSQATFNYTFLDLELLGATFSLATCNTCAMVNVNLLYPTYNREILEANAGPAKGATAATTLAGSNNVIRNLTLAYTNNNGLRISGADTLLDNCLISYTDWVGTLLYAPLAASGNGIRVTRCTVHDFGNAGVITNIPNSPPAPKGQPQKPPLPMAHRHLEVAHTHIYRGGLVGKDTALLYTGGWNAAGLEWHHNWIHSGSEKCLRGDDQSRNMSVHHNVLFDCGLEPNVDVQSANSGIGLIIKGDGHMIYANTIFGANYTELCLPACNEPLKPFCAQYPLAPEQNGNSSIFNSAALNDFGYPCSCHNASDQRHPGGNQSAIFHGGLSSLKLVDVAHFDFRPQPSSPLVDKGVVWPPLTDGFVGAAPDIGAYEYGGERWLAGCQGLPGCALEP